MRRGLDTASVTWAIGERHAGYWIPLTWLSHMLDVELYGLDAGGHHATNALFHGANTLLLFLLLARGTGALLPSLFAAALFAVHPLRVESVAWVTERKDVLSTFFGLLAIASYGRYAARQRRADFLACAALLAASLAAKPMLVTLPFALLLLDVWPLGRLRAIRELGPRLVEKLPLIAIGVGFALATLLAQRNAAALGDAALIGADHVAPLLRLANAAVTSVAYLGMSVWPGRLSVLYPHPYLPGGTPWAVAEVFGATLALIALTAGAALALARRPALAVGWFWYLGTLVPVIGLVQSGAQGMADRFTYVPSMGLSVAIAWGVAGALGSGSRESDRGTLRGAAALLAVAGVGALAVASFFQVRTWRDAETLFVGSLEATPDNPMLRTYYGIWLQSEGRLREAAHQHREAARSDAYAAVSRANLAALSVRRGSVREAIGHYRAALEAEPDLALAHMGLARLLQRQGEIAGALSHFAEVIRIEPDRAAARVAAARILAKTPERQLRDPMRAVRLAGEAVEITGARDAGALDALAVAYSAAGKPGRAAETQRAAISRLPAGHADDAMRRRLAEYERRASSTRERPQDARAEP